jgi:predicted Ser/Thr protein kinase
VETTRRLPSPAADTVTAPELEPGTEFAGCRVERVVARGGMGVIYRCTDLRLHRPVAIKLIAAEGASDADQRRRFEREVRLTAAVDHPNVIPVYGAGEERGHLYLVMRYVDGTDLQALLKRGGALPPGRAAHIVEQVAAALDAAHAAGLVHRDIKPANVLLAAGDHAYLSDFGITCAAGPGTAITESGEWLGTLDFTSPEHLRGEPTTARSDVYALGCLLHCCLTGRPPFHRSTPAATVLAQLDDPPPRASDTPGVPAAFDAVIARALAKEPAGRYARAGELGAAVRAAAGADVLPGPEPQPEPAPTAAPEPPEMPTEAIGERERTVRLGRVRSIPRRLALAAAAALAAMGAAAGAAILLAASAGGVPSGPLSSGDVAGAVRGFAHAYGHHDLKGLSDLLAPDVERVSPAGVERGRPAVLAEYRRQLARGGVGGYVLRGLSVQPGWAGRASATYAVPRTGGSFGGTVVFGVKRVHGSPRIGLIATRPQG